MHATINNSNICLKRTYQTLHICHVIIKLLLFISPLGKVVSNPSRTVSDRRSCLKEECRSVNIEFNRIRKIKNLVVQAIRSL